MIRVRWSVGLTGRLVQHQHNVDVVPDWCDKEVASPEGKALNLLYVSTLTYGHKLWVVTETMRLWIEATEISFLLSMSGLSLSDRGRILE